jgi:surfactin synthase thioesterase subunit
MNVPLAFFGHSMGAAIAFELARELYRSDSRTPTRLFLSGRRAPHLPARRPAIHRLPNEEFRLELRRLKGTPPELLDNSELMDLVMSCLRADFELAETYLRSPEDLLDIPLHVFGYTDLDTTVEELNGWSLHSRRFEGVTLFPGGHFFLANHKQELMRIVQQNLAV